MSSGRCNVLRCNKYCPGCGIHIFTTGYGPFSGLDYRGETKCVCVVVDGEKIDGIELSNHGDWDNEFNTIHNTWDTPVRNGFPDRVAVSVA